MDQKKWQQIEPILDNALQIDDPSKRDAYIRDVCGEDEQLCKELRELLHSIKMAKEVDFLESSGF